MLRVAPIQGGTYRAFPIDGTYCYPRRVTSESGRSWGRNRLPVAALGAAAIGLTISWLDLVVAVAAVPEAMHINVRVLLTAFAVTAAGCSGILLLGLACAARLGAGPRHVLAVWLGVTAALLVSAAADVHSMWLYLDYWSSLPGRSTVWIGISILTAIGMAVGTVRLTTGRMDRACLSRRAVEVPALLALVTVWAWRARLPWVGAGEVLVLSGAACGVGALVLIAVRWAVTKGFSGRLMALQWVVTLALAVGLARSPFYSRDLRRQDGPPDPNASTVVLITVDTLRYDAVGPAGPDSLTPRLDALARESLVFDRAVAPSPWTLPSLASVISGLLPAVHGVERSRRPLPDSVTTVAEQLADAGYRTAVVGSSPFLDPAFDLLQGFETVRLVPRQWPRRGFGTSLVDRLWTPSEESAADLVKLAGRWLEDQTGQSVFLWLHMLDPHIPYRPPPDLAPDGPPPNGLGEAFRDVERIRSGVLTLDHEQQAWLHRLYEGEVRAVDREIGAVLDLLTRLGRADHAVVIVTADHGEEFWDHGRFEHGHSLYQELVHVPLLLKAPSVQPGRRERPVSIAAVAPTIYELCGLSAAHELSVGSLLTVSHDAVVSRGALYFEPREAAIIGRFKLIRNLVSGSDELYDLEVDPHEQRSVLDLEPEAAAMSRGALEASSNRADRLRRSLGLEDDGRLHIEPATRRRLEALGYSP